MKRLHNTDEYKEKKHINIYISTYAFPPDSGGVPVAED